MYLILMMSFKRVSASQDILNQSRIIHKILNSFNLQLNSFKFIIHTYIFCSSCSSYLMMPQNYSPRPLSYTTVCYTDVHVSVYRFLKTIVFKNLSMISLLLLGTSGVFMCLLSHNRNRLSAGSSFDSNNRSLKISSMHTWIKREV